MGDSDFERLEQTVRRAVDQIESLRTEKAELEVRLKALTADKSRVSSQFPAAIPTERTEEAKARLQNLIDRLKALEAEL